MIRGFVLCVISHALCCVRRVVCVVACVVVCVVFVFLYVKWCVVDALVMSG